MRKNPLKKPKFKIPPPAPIINSEGKDSPLPEKKKKEFAKSTDAEIKLRVYEVYTMILAGHGKATIDRYVGQKWGVGERQSDQYIAEARRWLYAEVSLNVKEAVREGMRLRQNIYEKAIAAGHYGEALQCLQDMAKLSGTYPTEKHKLQIEDARTLSDFLKGKPVAKIAGKDVTPDDGYLDEGEDG